MLHYGNSEELWKEAYNLGRKCRDAGMSWNNVRECCEHMENAVSMTGYFERYDTGGDCSESDYDFMRLTGEGRSGGYYD